MTISQLRYIIALDTHQSFSKASKACYVTQPTLSMQIHKLEEEIGITLFDRSKQPVKPTELGKQVIAQARVIIQEANRLNQLISDRTEEIKGELKIGIIPTVAPYLLPRFIKSFTEDHPTIHLVAKELKTEDIIEALRKETIDAGILVTPLHERGIIEEPLFYEAFTVYASTRHPISQKETIHPADLDPGDIWLLNEGHCFRDQTINLCAHGQDHATRQNFEFESGSLETLKNLVDQEYGYTLMPEMALQKVRNSKRAVIRHFAEPAPLREVSMVVNRTFLKKKLIKALERTIKKSVPRHMLQKDRGMIVEYKA